MPMPALLEGLARLEEKPDELQIFISRKADGLLGPLLTALLIAISP